MISKDNAVKNVVTFLGPERSVRQIRRQIWKVFDGERDMVFNPEAIIPIPKNLQSLEESQAFCERNWGCTGSFSNDMELDANCISFETKEHPPRGVFKRLSELHPDVSILVEFARYDDKGFDNAGLLLYQNGKVNEAVATNQFSEILLHDVQGEPFSVSRSKIFDFEKDNKEKNNDKAIAGIAKRMLENEQRRLYIVIQLGQFLTSDTSIISSSAVLKQVEENCNTLRDIVEKVTANENEDKKRIDVSKVLTDKGENLSYFDADSKTIAGNQNKSVSKNQMAKRNVLTKPKYFRVSRTQSANKDDSNERK